MSGLSKKTRFSLTEFPYAGNIHASHARNKGKNSHSKHPYMREGFVFKCCDKVNHSYNHDHK